MNQSHSLCIWELQLKDYLSNLKPEINQDDFQDYSQFLIHCFSHVEHMIKSQVVTILRNVKYTNLWLKPTCKLGIRAKISIILWRSFNELPLMSKWVKCGIISRGFKSTIWFFEVFNTRSFFNFEHDLGSNTTFWWGARSWWSTCNSGIEL